MVLKLLSCSFGLQSSGVSFKARHWATWHAVKTALLSSFQHLCNYRFFRFLKLCTNFVQVPNLNALLLQTLMEPLQIATTPIIINNGCLLNILQLKNWITVLKYMWIHYNTKTILSYLQVKISINNIYKKLYIQFIKSKKRARTLTPFISFTLFNPTYSFVSVSALKGNLGCPTILISNKSFA